MQKLEMETKAGDDMDEKLEMDAKPGDGNKNWRWNSRWMQKLETDAIGVIWSRFMHVSVKNSQVSSCWSLVHRPSRSKNDDDSKSINRKTFIIRWQSYFFFFSFSTR